MGRYIIKRFGQALVVVLIISVVAFSLIHLVPEDPVYKMFGEEITQDEYLRYKHDMGLDKSLTDQYFSFMAGFFTGHMGWSYSCNEEVASLILSRVGITIFLGVCSAVLGVVLGVVLGIICATHKDSVIDQALTTVSNVLVGSPQFWIAVVLVYIFSIKLGIFKSYGFVYPWDDFAGSLKTIVLPIIVMSLGTIVTYTRQTRSAMLEVIKQDYIRTAKSKGLRQGKIIYGHALKNALIPILTLLGTTMRQMVAGSVITESVFNIRGIGLLLVTAIKQLDYPLVQSLMMILCLVTCISNMIVDIAYAYADPRIRLMK